MSAPWPCRMCRRDVCPDCAVEPAPCEHDELCMDCWDTCSICHAVDVTAESAEDAAYAVRVANQMAALSAAIAAPSEPYSPAHDPFYVPPRSIGATHERTELLRAAYAMKRAECACGWHGDWHPYNHPQRVEADWATHLEATK